VTTIDPDIDDFILLASDGLFDRFTSQECVNLARGKLASMPVMEQDTAITAKALVLEAI
jgi:serine/threonine protein phosphatase PrpC